MQLSDDFDSVKVQSMIKNKKINELIKKDELILFGKDHPFLLKFKEG